MARVADRAYCRGNSKDRKKSARQIYDEHSWITNLRTRVKLRERIANCQENPVTRRKDRLPQGAMHSYIHESTRCAEVGRSNQNITTTNQHPGSDDPGLGATASLGVSTRTAESLAARVLGPREEIPSLRLPPYAQMVVNSCRPHKPVVRFLGLQRKHGRTQLPGAPNLQPQ